MNITCQQIEERFVELGDEAFVNDDTCQNHLAGCNSCKATFTQLAEVDRLVAAMPVVDAPHVNFDFEPAGIVQRDWHVVIDDQQVGPFSFEQLQEEWHAARINETTMVWRAGMEDWQAIGEMKALAELCAIRPRNQVLGNANGTPVGGVVTEPTESSQWQPSAAVALADLMKQELDGKPKATESSGPSGTSLGLPAMPVGSGGAGQRDLDSVLQMGRGATGWSLPIPKQERGVRAWQMVGAGVGFSLAAALLIFLAVGNGNTPNEKATPPTAPVFAVAPGTTGAAGETTPPPRSPSSDNPLSAGAQPPEAPKEVVSPREESPRERRQPRAPGGERKRPPQNGGTKRNPDRNSEETPRPASAPPLDKKAVVAALKSQAKSVVPCLSAAKSKGELRPGRYQLVLDWNIKPDGSVKAAKVTGPASVLSTSIPACFATKMRSWKFPASAKGMPIRNFPFPAFTVK